MLNRRLIPWRWRCVVVLNRSLIPWRWWRSIVPRVVGGRSLSGIAVISAPEGFPIGGDIGIARVGRTSSAISSTGALVGVGRAVGGAEAALVSSSAVCTALVGVGRAVRGTETAFVSSAGVRAALIGDRGVIRGGVPRFHHAVSGHNSWPRACGHSRLAMIRRIILGLVGAGRVLMLHLFVGGLHMVLMLRAALLGVGLCVRSPVAAIEAGAINCGVVVDDGPVVGIVDHGDVDVVHRGVVGEHAAAPFPTQIANSDVPESVIDPAIKSNVGTPIAGMPQINAIAPTPVTGSPKHSNPGRANPGAGNPIVAVIAVSPVAGRPDVSLARANGLSVNRQSRWADVNRNAYTHGNLRGRRRWNCHHGNRKDQEQNVTEASHIHHLSKISGAWAGGKFISKDTPFNKPFSGRKVARLELINGGNGNLCPKE